MRKIPWIAHLSLMLKLFLQAFSIFLHNYLVYLGESVDEDFGTVFDLKLFISNQKASILLGCDLIVCCLL